MGAFLFVLSVCVVVAAVGMLFESQKVSRMTPSQKAKYRQQQKIKGTEALHGPANPAMICPHCQVSGQIHTKPITQKKGVSGAKATGAIFTGGVSMLATGLSRKEKNTQAYCRNCQNTWVI